MKKIIFLSSVCGVGKSTVCDYLKANNLLDEYVIFDADELLNIHDYNDNIKFYEDIIKEAIKKSGDKNILLASCINPVEIERINMPDDIESKEMILLYCSSIDLTNRLTNRDPSRNCSSDEFIKGQIEYQNYMLNHASLFGLVIDNTNESISDTAINITKFIEENNLINERK